VVIKSKFKAPGRRNASKKIKLAGKDTRQLGSIGSKKELRVQRKNATMQVIMRLYF